MTADNGALVPPRVRAGDHVRLVSPSSYPSHEHVEYLLGMLTGWGLVVEVGEHVFDEHGYMAGTDEHRLADFNEALRDPAVRAIIPTAGGAGAYRIVDGLDFEAARRDPKPVTGFSDTTNLHLALWEHSRVVGIHGGYIGDGTPESMHRALMRTDPVVLHRNPDDVSAAVTVEGEATGFLMGGNLGVIVRAVGAGLPSLDGAILFFESFIGGGSPMIDQALFQLTASGALDGVRGIAIGHLTGNPAAVRDDEPDGWTAVEMLQERLGDLGIPVLGGLPLGHDPDPLTVPLGTTATIDTNAGTLTVAAGVC